VVPIKRFGGKPPVFSRDHYNYGLLMKIPIFEGGRLWSRLSAAEITEAISRESLHLTKQELVAGITNLFNRILYLQKLTESQRVTLDALEKARADAETRLRVGRIAPVDLMRMETQVAAQEQALVSAKEETVRTRQLLARMIGRDPSWSPEVAGKLCCPSDNWAEPSADISQRPDIRKAMHEVELAKSNVKYAMGYHLPSVGLVGDYGRRAGSGFDGDEEVWQGGVEVSFNIFSGGSVEAGVRQARAKLLAAEERLRHARLNALTELKNAASSLRETRKRFLVAEKNRTTAKETWRIEDLKYRTGAGTVTDSLLAQSTWFQAEADTLGALYEYQAARVALELAAGTIDSAYQDRDSGSMSVTEASENGRSYDKNENEKSEK
jgi:outer membrane protein TolC